MGAPEDEVANLKGRLDSLAPENVGYYIEMSEKRGMDGGWFLIGDYPISTAMDCMDCGTPRDSIAEWTKQHSIEKCHFFARDIGATPPRQTEIRLVLPGETLKDQLAAAENLYTNLGVPFVPQDELAHLHNYPTTDQLHLTVIAVEASAVQLGLCVPKPSEDLFIAICRHHRAKQELHDLQLELGFLLPSFLEFRYLMPGYGYLVYTEGHSVHFHYQVCISRNFIYSRR